MTPDELLAKVLSFDGGKPPTLNGFIVEDDDDISERYNYTITKRNSGEKPWAVLEGQNTCLSTGGKWDCEPIPSARTEHFIKTHRYSTFEAAFEALDKFKKKALRAAKKAGWKTYKQFQASLPEISHT